MLTIPPGRQYYQVLERTAGDCFSWQSILSKACNPGSRQNGLVESVLLDKNGGSCWAPHQTTTGRDPCRNGEIPDLCESCTAIRVHAAVKVISDERTAGPKWPWTWRCEVSSNTEALECRITDHAVCHCHASFKPHGARGCRFPVLRPFRRSLLATIAGRSDTGDWLELQTRRPHSLSCVRSHSFPGLQSPCHHRFSKGHGFVEPRK